MLKPGASNSLSGENYHIFDSSYLLTTNSNLLECCFICNPSLETGRFPITNSQERELTAKKFVQLHHIAIAKFI